MMYHFLAVSRENTEKAMLISLIVILGIIMYMKLIKSLKKKRLNNTFSSIDSYDVENKELVVRYTVPGAIKSAFIFQNETGAQVGSYDINQTEKGSYEFRTAVSDFKDQSLVLSFTTENQKITKKIRLNV